jgi:bifunctional non-homologous end joining protein LigD
MKPMLATLVKSAPAGDGWLHEIKYDGYRLRLERDGDGMRLLSRRAWDAVRGRWLESVSFVNLT